MVLRGIIERQKAKWRALDNWPSVPRKRTRSLKIIIPILFITGFILFIPQFFQNASAERVFDGVYVPDPDRDASMNLNFSNQAQLNESNKYYIKIPYKIKNLGNIAIENILIDIKIRIEFETKDGKEEDREVFSKKKDVGKVHPGKSIEGSFDYDYRDTDAFDGENIFFYMYNVKGSGDTEFFMDVIVSFELSGNSGYKIIYEDIDLTDDTETPQTSGKVETSQQYRAGFDTMDVIIIVISFSAMFLILGRRRKEKEKEEEEFHLNNRRHLNFGLKDFLKKHKSFFTSLLFLIIFTIIPIFLYINNLSQQKSTVVKGVTTSDYTEKFEMATWLNVGFLIVIYIMTLLPTVKPNTFKVYSVQRGLNSLGISILVFISLLIWADYTSLIAYEIDNSATVIIDTSPSFLPYIWLSSITIGLKAVDLLILVGYRNQFAIIRGQRAFQVGERRRDRVERERRRPNSAEELNKSIFSAIKELEERASFRQITRYFNRIGIVTTAITGERLEIRYLEHLINQFYISRDENNIFSLEEDGLKFLKERERQEEEKRILEDHAELILCTDCEALNPINAERCFGCQKEL